MAPQATPELRRDLLRLAQHRMDVRDFSLGAARLLARTVPFDGVCVLTMDPATLLPTGEVVENGLPSSATARMTEIELDGRDANSFGGLAVATRPAATLSHATGGDLERSRRHRELRGPHGFGDELRAVLSDEGTTWGALTLLRAAGEPNFTPDDAALVASLSGLFAEGLRRAMLFTALPAQPTDPDAPAGLVVLAADDTIALTDAAADRWLAELGSGGPAAVLPQAVRAVAAAARRSNDPGGSEPALARVRVRCPSGLWLLVRGSLLGAGPDAPAAVLIEPARGHDLAPLLAAAHGLTERERAVAELVARGLPTSAIAEHLHLSAWTVQDHLKSIFERVGVGSRGELVARLFFEPGRPRLNE
jgi:DNA-binding NarL/FixJ family response regulator